MTTISEFEEKYSHGFDNTAGTGTSAAATSGSIKAAGSDLQLRQAPAVDVTLLEPGTNFILTQTLRPIPRKRWKPPPFTATAKDIDEGNYTTWAKLYDATGLEPPPERVRTIVKAFDGVLARWP